MRRRIDFQVSIDLPCFPEFNSDLEFVQRLLMEESVFCLPGQVSFNDTVRSFSHYFLPFYIEELFLF